MSDPDHHHHPTVDELRERMDALTLRPRPRETWREFDARCRAGDLPEVYREAFVIKAADVIERKDKRIMALELQLHMLKIADDA